MSFFSRPVAVEQRVTYSQVINNVVVNADNSKVQGTLELILAELKKGSADTKTLTAVEFYNKLKQYLYANFSSVFASGQIPYPSAQRKHDGTGEPDEKDLVADILGDAFWAMNSDKGLENIFVLQAFVLMIQFKQGKRVSDSVTEKYKEKSKKAALVVASTVQDFAKKYDVKDEALTALVTWCLDVVLSAQTKMGADSF